MNIVKAYLIKIGYRLEQLSIIKTFAIIFLISNSSFLFADSYPELSLFTLLSPIVIYMLFMEIYSHLRSPIIRKIIKEQARKEYIRDNGIGNISEFDKKVEEVEKELKSFDDKKNKYRMFFITGLVGILILLCYQSISLSFR